MFGTRTFIIFLGMLTLSIAINPDNLCVLISDDLKVVDEDNCAGYYSCKAGKATAETCPNGNYFSKDLQACKPKSDVSCLGEDENACEGIYGEKYVAMPGSCSGYYYCKDGVSTAGYCPNSLNFDPDEQKCQYSSVYGCAATGGNPIDTNPDLLCGYFPNGYYFGSAISCDTWQKCTKNKVTTGTCKSGQEFDVQTRSCIFSSGNSDCQQLNGNSEETGGLPEEACTPADPVKKEDPRSCSSYLECRDGKYAAKKCDTSLYYDTLSKKCTNRLDAVNDCDRCEGTTLNFVNAYDENCESYLICSNGKRTGKNKCDDGFFFNEKYGSCVRGSNPEFKACKPLDDCGTCVQDVVGDLSICNDADCKTDNTCECFCAACT